MTVVVGELELPIIFCEVAGASDNWQVTRRRLGLITYLSWCQKCGHWVMVVHDPPSEPRPTVTNPTHLITKSQAVPYESF